MSATQHAVAPKFLKFNKMANNELIVYPKMTDSIGVLGYGCLCTNGPRRYNRVLYVFLTSEELS